jgi:aminoglycoside phosphotransferase (APT) family kinase protein
MSDAGAPEVQKLTTSTRDRDVMRADLGRWLVARLGAELDPVITDFEVPESNGMSSETLLFTAEWTEDGVREPRRLVMRQAPAADAFPVFERYDLTRQFETMRRVRKLSGVPVPEVLWNEPDSAPLGAPFFVMRRVDGIVPPDVMPYTFGSWLTEATTDERDRLWRSTVDVLASLGNIADAEQAFDILRPSISESPSALRRHVDESRRWLDWSVGDEPSPLLDRCFRWLDEHWPAEEPETVLSWGDARIGNVMYDDFRPVAVLDWEMAALAPREVDLAWFIFLHRFFDDLAVDFGMAPMPSDFVNRDLVEAAYADASGYTPRDMDWYLMYAATRHGIVFTRTSRRAAHFGDAEMPADPDDAIMHRATLEAMMAGTYWSDLAARG